MRTMTVSVLLAIVIGSSAQAGVLAPGLFSRMEALDERDVLKVLVVMRDRPDIQALDKSLYKEAAPLAMRHKAVVSSLMNVAGTSQQGILADLTVRRADKVAGGVRGFTPHWIVNSIVLVAEVATIREIAARDDVEIVEPDLEVELIEPVMTKIAADWDPTAAPNGFVTPGIVSVNAPRVWSELGFDGTGTLVANMDSGVEATHEMLFDRWHGNFAPVSECWRDHAGVGSPDFPVDLHGHGTHTIGTITGATATDTVGVAPGAHWIASNAVYTGGDREDFDNAIIAGFEFFADPDGDPATTDDVPDVVQNSWGVSPDPAYGYVPCDSRWWDAIDNCEAAGVVVTWSAGNEGPTKGSVRSPGDRASSPTNCFTVGSVGFGIPYVVSNFSSRGPSGCGGAYAIKPEVVAPGEDILSSMPGNTYGYMSGTSMAGPHVAGIVALMRQANPDIDVTDVKQILMDTAIDVGISGNDNASGYGMVDAYEAVLAAMTDIAVVEGTVTAASTGLPLPNVAIRRPGVATGSVTDAAGFYSLTMRSGPAQLEFSKFSYESQTASLVLAIGDTIVQDISLDRLPVGIVSGVVYGPDGQAVEGARVYAKDVSVTPDTTGTDGSYVIILPLDDDVAYQIVVTALDLAYVTEFIGLTGNRVLDFHLPNIIAEGFETGTLGSFPWQTGGQAPMAANFEEAQEGIFSARSGDITDGQTSELSLDYYVAGAGEISFYVKTDSENGYDGLVFSIDGLYQNSWSGTMDWVRHSYPVNSGLHHFKWEYSKDYAVSVGRDAAWIDRIEFPGTGVEPQPQIQINQTNLTMSLNPDYADSTILSVANIGGYRLDYTVQVSTFLLNSQTTAEYLAGESPASLVQYGILGSPNKSGVVSWAMVNPASGWIHPGVARDLTVTFDAAGMAHGVYYALMDILSNDPVQPVKTVPLIFTVGGISAVDQVAAPPRVTLAGAVPNPFNPVTHISYTLPTAGFVSLRIFDVSGRLINNLVAEPRSAGQHRERWDGRDQSGREVASGVYMSRLSVGEVTEIKSMLLLR
jgi:subtilisin family serine protease